MNVLAFLSIVVSVSVLTVCVGVANITFECLIRDVDVRDIFNSPGYRGNFIYIVIGFLFIIVEIAVMVVVQFCIYSVIEQCKICCTPKKRDAYSRVLDDLDALEVNPNYVNPSNPVNWTHLPNDKIPMRVEVRVISNDDIV